MSLSAMYPHRIRLRGPWECERIPWRQDSDPAERLSGKIGILPPQPHRVIMPCRWIDAGLTDFHGSARFIRKFGYPGRIDETERVWLTCDGVTGCREVSLNGQQLAQETNGTFAFDVTKILSARNRLEVVIQGDSHESGLWGEVALEIRKDAFLADMHLERSESAVHLTGKVVGVAAQPLELYVLVDGRHVDYRTVMPSVSGTPIRIELADLTPAHQTVRAELINISSIWYVIELPIPHWKSV